MQLVYVYGKRPVHECVAFRREFAQDNTLVLCGRSRGPATIPAFWGHLAAGRSVKCQRLSSRPRPLRCRLSGSGGLGPVHAVEVGLAQSTRDYS
jgi:hypothetical protein